MTWLALLLHAALMAGAALLLHGLTSHLAALWRGEPPPPFRQPARDLRRLWRKTTTLPANASFLLAAAPAASLAAAAIAALLTPSFLLGTPFAPGADLIVLAALLAASHAALALATHDLGWSVLAHAGTTAATARTGLAPLVMAATMSIMLLSGGTNLDAAIAAIRDGGLLPHIAGLLTGLTLLAATAAEPPIPHDAFPGRLAALALAATALRFATGLALAAAIALPFAVTGPGTGPLSWPLPILCWALKMAALATAAAALTRAIARWRLLLPAAALLALLAIALASLQGRA